MVLRLICQISDSFILYEVVLKLFSHVMTTQVLTAAFNLGSVFVLNRYDY